MSNISDTLSIKTDNQLLKSKLNSRFLTTKSHMATLNLLIADDNPQIGAVLCEFPSGARKTAGWRSEVAVSAFDLGKALAVELLQSCLADGRIDDAERTNWASMAAACGRLVADWNSRLGGAGVGERPAVGNVLTPSLGPTH